MQMYNNQQKTPERKYNSGRSSLLLMTVLSLVNLVITIGEVDLYFPFSAFAPLVAYIFGAQMKGPYLVMGITLAIIMILVYALCYILSKNKPGFLIAALVLFVLDTLLVIGFMLIEFDPNFIINIVFHVYVLFCLIIGVAAIKPLKIKYAEEQQEQLAG